MKYQYTNLIFTTIILCILLLLPLSLWGTYARHMSLQGREYSRQQDIDIQQEAGMYEYAMSKPRLYIGESGVRQVQEALNTKGYSAGKADGNWDEKTKKALMDFQEAQGIESTGELNLETMQLLVERADIQPVGKAHSGTVRGYYGEKEGAEE